MTTISVKELSGQTLARDGGKKTPLPGASISTKPRGKGQLLGSEFNGGPRETDGMPSVDWLRAKLNRLSGAELNHILELAEIMVADLRSGVAPMANYSNCALTRYQTENGAVMLSRKERKAVAVFTGIARSQGAKLRLNRWRVARKVGQVATSLGIDKRSKTLHKLRLFVKSEFLATTAEMNLGGNRESALSSLKTNLNALMTAFTAAPAKATEKLSRAAEQILAAPVNATEKLSRAAEQILAAPVNAPEKLSRAAEQILPVPYGERVYRGLGRVVLNFRKLSLRCVAYGAGMLRSGLSIIRRHKLPLAVSGVTGTLAIAAYHFAPKLGSGLWNLSTTLAERAPTLINNTSVIGVIAVGACIAALVSVKRHFASMSRNKVIVAPLAAPQAAPTIVPASTDSLSRNIGITGLLTPYEMEQFLTTLEDGLNALPSKMRGSVFDLLNDNLSLVAKNGRLPTEAKEALLSELSDLIGAYSSPHVLTPSSIVNNLASFAELIAERRAANGSVGAAFDGVSGALLTALRNYRQAPKMWNGHPAPMGHTFRNHHPIRLGDLLVEQVAALILPDQMKVDVIRIVSSAFNSLTSTEKLRTEIKGIFGKYEGQAATFPHIAYFGMLVNGGDVRNLNHNLLNVIELHQQMIREAISRGQAVKFLQHA